MNTELISRQTVIDSLYDWSNHSMTDAETWHLKQIIGDIRNMPSVNLQPCEDAISREAVISIIEESQEDDADEWMGYPWKVTPNLLMYEVRKLPSVTPKQEPCDDAISRQAAIDAFSMFAEYESNRTNAEWVDRIRVVLSSLPPVQPISRWIPVTDKLPNDCDEDWVLVQIQEDNGYLWIPRVMEYRKSKDDWWGEDIGWLKNHNGAFKVIAWMPLPEPYEPKKSEEQA